MIDNEKDIAIYGAGSVADFLFYRLCSLGYREKIKLFLVTDMGGNENSKFGIKVCTLSEAVDFLNSFRILIATMPKDQMSIAKLLDGYGLANYEIIDSEEIINSFFAGFEKDPINKFKILGQNQRTAGYGDNPKYIFEELHRRDQNNKLDLVWSVGSFDSSIPSYVRQVIFGSKQYYYELSTAHIWIDNSRKSRVIRKRDGQIYIQSWHGAAPIKKVEADVINSLSDSYIECAKHDSKLADLFISGSEFYSELYKKSFWYTGEILKSGLPRQDLFWRREWVRKLIHEKYHIEENTNIVLYAPTFRKTYTDECYNIHLNDIANALEQRFGSKFIFLVSRHPDNHVRYPFSDENTYIEIDRNQDFEEILASADVLITDYSGCMYDFSFSRKPIFLFQTDYDDYLKDRNFYISMDKLPYICAHSNDDLISQIREFDYYRYLKELDRFMESMGNYDNGTSSSQVVDYIIEHYLGEL